jgi:hypothetical protein
MFGSVVLEVAIGLVFVYLLISLMVTAVTEIVAGLLKTRAKNLWKGIRNILDSGTASTWVDQLYSHPLVASLCSPHKEQDAATSPGTKAKVPRHGPSYLPSRTFAVSLLEILREPRRALGQQIDRIPDSVTLPDLKQKLAGWVGSLPNGAKGQAEEWLREIPDGVSTDAAKKKLREIAAADLPEIIAGIPDAKLRGTLLALHDEAKGDVDELKKNLEIWFNNSMDRVSGWYKRRTQVFTFAVAAVLVLFLNVDTVLLVRALSENQALRDALVKQAEAFEEPSDGAPADAAGEPDGAAGEEQIAAGQKRFRELRSEITALGLPIGWKQESTGTDFRQFPGLNMPLWGQTILFHLLGWIVTMFAVSLGAPFWFDILNKIITIRSSGKAPEEKPKAPEKVPQPREPGNVPAPSEQKVVVEVRGAVPG